MPCRIHASDQAGLTLLELIITIALLAVVLALAVPGFQSVIQNNRATAQANEMITALQLARSEAIKRGQPVTVCAADTLADDPDCEDDWTKGWMVVLDTTDSAGNSTAPGADEDNTLRVWLPPADGSSIEVSGGKTFVRYLQRGQIDGSAVTMTMTLPKCTIDNAREIQILSTGRVAVERKECGG